MKSTGSNTPALAGTSVKTCLRATYVAAMVVDLDMFTGPAQALLERLKSILSLFLSIVISTANLSGSSLTPSLSK